MLRSDSIYSNYSGSSGERKPAPRSQGSLHQMQQQSGLPNTICGGDLQLRRNNNNNGGGKSLQRATQMLGQGASSSSRSMDSTRSCESMRSKDCDSIQSRDTYDASFRSLGNTSSFPEHGGAANGAGDGGGSGSGYPPPPPPPRSIYDNAYYEHQAPPPPQRSSHYHPEMMDLPPPSRSSMSSHHYSGQPPQAYGGSRGGLGPPPPSNKGLQIEIEPCVCLCGTPRCRRNNPRRGRGAGCRLLVHSLQFAPPVHPLCPDCKVVSPLFHGNTGGGRGAVGLGLRAEQSQNYPQDYYGGGHGGGGGRYY